MAKRALLLVNRQARKGKKSLAQAVEILDDLDFELITAPIKKPQQLSDCISQYEKQIDMVIVGGGDGTLNAVVNILVGKQLPLGILPLGTANDLARTLSIPQSISEACQVIADGKLKYIDLGWVNGKYFFNVASLGLSVGITQKLSQGSKSQWGILAYALTALQVIGKTRPFHAQIRAQDRAIRVRTIQIAIGNGRYYGGGMPIVNDAAIDDRRLDLYSLELQHWWQIFSLLWTLPQGRQHSLPWVRTLEGEEIEIRTGKPYRINTDGELTVSTPATFRVIPRALAVFTPTPDIEMEVTSQ